MLALVLLATLASAEGRLPVERIGTAQGLVSDRVTHILRDSRGLLWIGTKDGVSRYDGHRFVSYATPFVTTIAETRDGAIVVATIDGLRRLAPDGRAFETIAAGVAVNDIAQDRHGVVWVACDEALCRLEGNRLVRDASYRGATVQVLAAGDDLWAGSQQGLLRRRANGTWEHYVVSPHRDSDAVQGMSIDPRGRLWIGTSFGFFVTTPAALRSPLQQHAPFTRLTREGAPIVITRTPLHTRDATWIPTSIGVVRVDARGTRLLDARDGVPEAAINGVAEDVAGNVWIGGELGGLIRVTRSGLTTFTTAHGLGHDRITSLFETDRGVCMTSGPRRDLQCFENGVLTRRELIPRSIEFQGWGWGEVVTRDGAGDWWVATAEGVVRWSADLSRVVATYDSNDGLGGDDVFRIWRDSRGDLWFSTFGKRVLTRWSNGRFIAYDDVPRIAPTAFAEDRQGNLWFGLYTGGLLRFDGKRFTKITEGVPTGFVHDLLFDSRGTLWIAATGGVSRMPGGVYSTRGARALSEMPDGRIVIGTPRGVEIAGGGRLSTADGLPNNEIIAMLADRSGALWLGTAHGLSMWRGLQPAAGPRAEAPRAEARATFRARIDSIDGVAIPELGAHQVGPLRLAYPDHRMTVAFSAPDFDARHPLQFEYRLSGDGAWTPAGTRRSVSYERLPFGRQQFEVRVAGAKEAATVSLSVVPPLWRRWWFLALAAALLVALALLLHRMRVAHLMAIQEMRMRVATDLHDDLGSSLSRISILSELAKQKSNARVLDEIGDTARGLVDALGDSIWSIDPRRDDLQSVLARVRHFAADVLEARSIGLDFDVPQSIASLQLTPDKRREVFLILKEAINNAAKHSQASRVAVAAHVDGARLRLRIEDDGVGFAEPREGHGLPSMSARAQRAGGTLHLASTPGLGTRIEVTVPL
ncbi:MAG TPA: two-component regulator propeller domain-containing protein [Thermoanaerobaculia bacterium]